ncbi:MAG: DUF3226 domain-containing protein, partial [Cyanobacteria bacterium J06635_10]
MVKKKKYIAKKLIVEGEQDKRVIPEFIEAKGIPWGETRDTAIVDIEVYGGNQFIDSDFIATELKASGLTNLGLIVDADDDYKSRWESIRNACLKIIPDFPQELSKTGLIHQTNTGIKFGVWITPNNQQQGMLETFLSYMIDDENESTWQYSQDVVKEAKNKGASFKYSHFDKANIYTWLAWQNEPGRQLHQAIKERILNPNHPKADVFFNWFKA